MFNPNGTDDIQVGDVFRLVEDKWGDKSWVHTVTPEHGFILICTGVSKTSEGEVMFYSGKSIATGFEFACIWRDQMEKADV